jgi:hypothetical protein
MKEYNFYDTEFGKEYKNWINKFGDRKKLSIYVRSNKTYNKFYVGYTSNYNRRYNGYYPINKFIEKNNINDYWLILPIPKNLSIEEAELYIFSAIGNYFGIENVRGAHLTTKNLPKRKGIITKLERHLNNTCYKCNKFGHYVRNCPY